MTKTTKTVTIEICGDELVVPQNIVPDDLAEQLSKVPGIRAALNYHNMEVTLTNDETIF